VVVVLVVLEHLQLMELRKLAVVVVVKEKVVVAHMFQDLVVLELFFSNSYDKINTRIFG
jgi:hypothetical protein